MCLRAVPSNLRMKKRCLDLRERSSRAFSSVMNRSQVCEVFGIHRTTLRCWQVRQEASLLAPLPSPGAKPKLSPADEERLLLQLQADPDTKVNEHLYRWQEDQGGQGKSPGIARTGLPNARHQGKAPAREARKSPLG